MYPDEGAGGGVGGLEGVEVEQGAVADLVGGGDAVAGGVFGAHEVDGEGGKVFPKQGNVRQTGRI
ncbi:hypothetical protein [uncultured Bacteroides sp.]|uniref:hypothetical protein n=1 Tax=uncultured Bacteroides sp. TaxID=162156 RepID=UPI002608309C|nr:hypothetical protein [uncultured Bacteroides sp.]